MFQLDYSLVLYDLTSTYFEGLAAENELARRGYSRDHRADCKQVVVALVVTRDGFPLAHRTFAGNTRNLKTVQSIVTEIEAQFGKTQRIWVMDRGMISDESLKFLAESGRRYLLATRRGELAEFQAKLGKEGWKRLPNNPQVEVKLFKRKDVHYLLARSRPRRKKERAIRRRQRRGLARDLKKLCDLIDKGKAQEARQDPRASRAFEGPFPQGPSFPDGQRDNDETAQTRMVVGSSEVQASIGRGWSLPVTKQSTRLDGSRILGDLHPTDRGRTGLSSAQERFALTADLAPLQRANPGPCDGLRIGVRPLEDTRPSGQASGPGDRDPQTRSPQASVVTQAEADDTAGHPPGTRQSQDRRHLDEHHRRPGIGPPSRGPPSTRSKLGSWRL